MRNEGYDFSNLDKQDLLIKPLKLAQRTKLFAHKSLNTDDILERIKETLRVQKDKLSSKPS